MKKYIILEIDSLKVYDYMVNVSKNELGKGINAISIYDTKEQMFEEVLEEIKSVKGDLLSDGRSLI